MTGLGSRFAVNAERGSERGSERDRRFLGSDLRPVALAIAPVVVRLRPWLRSCFRRRCGRSRLFVAPLAAWLRDYGARRVFDCLLAARPILYSFWQRRSHHATRAFSGSGWSDEDGFSGRVITAPVGCVSFAGVAPLFGCDGVVGSFRRGSRPRKTRLRLRSSSNATPGARSPAPIGRSGMSSTGI